MCVVPLQRNMLRCSDGEINFLTFLKFSFLFFVRLSFLVNTVRFSYIILLIGFFFFLYSSSERKYDWLFCMIQQFRVDDRESLFTFHNNIWIFTSFSESSIFSSGFNTEESRVRWYLQTVQGRPHFSSFLVPECCINF